MKIESANGRDERGAIGSLRLYEPSKIPDWILEESVGYNYERGMGSDEIMGFLMGYMAALKAERERSSVLVEALVEIEKIQTELYHYKSSSLMVAEKALKECE